MFLVVSERGEPFTSTLATCTSVYSTAIGHQMMPGRASNDAPSHRAKQRRFDPPFFGVWSTPRLYP